MSSSRISAVLLAALACANAARCDDSSVPRRVVTICGERVEVLAPAELADRGIPVRGLSAEENAATDYLRGANALCELADELDLDWDAELDEQAGMATSRGWDVAHAELDEYLDAADDALAWYARGARDSACELPHPAEEISAFGAVVLSVLHGAELLAARAERSMARGDGGAALADIDVALRVACHVAAEPGILHLLVGAAHAKMALAVLARNVAGRALESTELERAAAILRELQAMVPDGGVALRGEKASALRLLDREILGELESGSGPLQRRVSQILLPFRTVRDDIAGFFDHAIALSASSPAEPWRLRETLYSRVKPWNAIAGILLFSLDRVPVAIRELRAELRVHAVLVAAERHRLREESFPDGLEPLVTHGLLAAAPADPFTGDALRYRKTDRELLIYSVGRDGEDAGGPATEFDDGPTWRPPEGDDVGVRVALDPLPRAGDDDDDDDEGGDDDRRDDKGGDA